MSNRAGTSSSATARAPRELLLLLTLAAMQFTHVLDFMIMMPLGPQFMRILALDPQHFAFLVSAYTFAAAASGFVAAFWVDRFGRKRALLAMYAGFIVATGLCGLAPNYPLLLLARIIAGVFGGIIGALIMTIVADVLPYSRRARGTALVASAFSLAAVLGVPLGLWFAAQYSWRMPFLALAGLSVAVGALAWRVLPPLDAHVLSAPRRHPVAQLRAVFGVRNHLTSFAFIVALMLSIFSVVPFIAPYYVANVGIAEADLPTIYFAGGLTTLFTAQVIGYLADRFGKKRVFTVVALLSFVPILLTNTPAAGVARVGDGDHGAVLRVGARPHRSRDGAGDRKRVAAAARQLHELQRVGAAIGIRGRGLRGGSHHRPRGRRHADQLWLGRLAVGRLHAARDRPGMADPRHPGRQPRARLGTARRASRFWTPGVRAGTIVASIHG